MGLERIAMYIFLSFLRTEDHPGEEQTYRPSLFHVCDVVKVEGACLNDLGLRSDYYY